MRLIDADKLKVAHGVFCPRVEGSREIYALPADAVFADEIESAPTVDAVPVIRCKDCKYCSVDRYADGNVPDYVCIEMDCGVEADGFCAWAERKKDETD